MTIDFYPCALFALLFMPVALIAADAFRIRHNPRYLVLSGCYALFVVNELLNARYGAPFAFYHVFLDGLVFSLAAASLTDRNREGAPQPGGGFLFHQAFLYLAMAACLALVLVSPAKSGALGITLTLAIGLFALVILLQRPSSDQHARLLILAFWIAAHLGAGRQHPLLNHTLTLVFVGLLTSLVVAKVMLANKKTSVENRLLFKSRDVVLSMLNDIASSAESATSIDSTLKRVIAAVTDTLEVESAALYVAEQAPGKPFNLRFSQAVGHFYPLYREDTFIIANRQLLMDRLEKTSYLMGDGIVGTVAKHGKAVMLNNPADHQQMASYGISTKYVRNVLAAPFNIKGKLYGVIVVQNSRNAPAFTADDAGLLQSLADQAGVSVNHTNMYVELTQSARLRQEASIANRIQRQFLPTKVPTPPNLRIAVFMEPAKELGGDYYDFVPYDDGSLGLVIGDVSGKGVPAALIMAIARAIVQIIGRETRDVRDIASRFSREIYHNMQQGQFMTINFLHWDGASRVLSFAGAGHEHVIWFHGGTGQTELIRAGGVAAGLMADPGEYIKRQELQLKKGDVIVLYTDGVTEARNPSGAMFTLRKLQAAVETYSYLGDPDQIRDHIVKDVTDFGAGAEQYDDITMMVLSVVS